MTAETEVVAALAAAIQADRFGLDPAQQTVAGKILSDLLTVGVATVAIPSQQPKVRRRRLNRALAVMLGRAHRPRLAVEAIHAAATAVAKTGSTKHCEQITMALQEMVSVNGGTVPSMSTIYRDICE